MTDSPAVREGLAAAGGGRAVQDARAVPDCATRREKACVSRGGSSGDRNVIAQLWITDGLFRPVDATLLLDQSDAPVVVRLRDADSEVVTPVILTLHHSVINNQQPTTSNDGELSHARHSGR